LLDRHYKAVKLNRKGYELETDGYPQPNASKKSLQLNHSHPKPIALPSQSSEFAEFLGMYYGDGSAAENPPVVTISLSYSEEKEYASFVRELIQKAFGITAGVVEHKKADNIQVRIYRIILVRFLKENIKRESGIPDWIEANPKFFSAFVRGLMDCEASVYRVEKGKKRIRIELKMHNKKLLEDVNTALLSLGYHPLIYLERNRLALARQEEVDRYFKEIGTHNPKHMKRYLSLRENHFPKLR
jgi:intein/homing endonuclease